MKQSDRISIILLAFLIILFCNSTVSGQAQQPKATYLFPVEIPPAWISSGVLYDLVIPLSHLDEQNADGTAPPVTATIWRQMYHEIYHASLDNSDMPEPLTIRQTAGAVSAEGVIPIALLHFRYHHLRADALEIGLIQRDDNALYVQDAAAFKENTLFAVTALQDYTYRGEQVTFLLDTLHLCFCNGAGIPQDLEIDFDDGQGFRFWDGQPRITVHYRTTGRKEVRVRGQALTGELVHSRFPFEVRRLRTPDPHETWELTADTPYDGAYGTGTAYIYLAESHAALTRPVIVTEGFDLDNEMYWDELYELLNQQELIETLRQIGYDAVVLNFTESTDPIQRNAFLFMKLLQEVRATVGYEAELPVIGPSMGGLVIRYALAWMESQSLEHGVNNFISFDSPQTGANIPLGVQYWMSFFAGESEEAAHLHDRLNTPAARQMLLYHATDPPGSTGEADPLRAVFLNDLASVGEYPALPRMIAIANGSSQMQNQGFLPGEQIIYYEYRNWLVDIDGNVWAVPNASQQMIFDGMINRIWPLPDDYLEVAVNGTLPWDNAPGGFRNSMFQMDTSSVPYGDVIALHENHCFIPTISALGLDVNDPFHPVLQDTALYTRTPLDSLYFPAENQEHVEITPTSVWWFIDEICAELPQPQIAITRLTTGMELSWAAIPGARSYKVYHTGNAYQWPSEHVVIADTVWVDPLPATQRYYRVVATTEQL